jgi:hypothetical protein
MKLVALVVICCFVIAPAQADPSKEANAKTTVKQYAFEAYPQWAMNHPDKMCPAKLADLNEFMNRKDLKDPWGHDYKMYCGKDLPPAAKGIGIASAGPDGKLGTDDDIASWK